MFSCRKNLLKKVQRSGQIQSDFQNPKFGQSLLQMAAVWDPGTAAPAMASVEVKNVVVLFDLVLVVLLCVRVYRAMPYGAP